MMDSGPYLSLPQCWPGNAWLAEVGLLAAQKLGSHRHGDLPRWRKALDALPPVETKLEFTSGLPRLGVTADQPLEARETLMEFHPWRKGPISLAGIRIDTEWRSDWKWERVAPLLDLDAELACECCRPVPGWSLA
jgi:tRNA (mo5U34)-methyltransferase